MAGADHPMLWQLIIAIPRGALTLAQAQQRRQGLDRGGCHGPEQFGQVGATLHAPYPLGNPLLEARTDAHPHQRRIGAVDLAAHRCRRLFGNGFYLLDHQRAVDGHDDAHVMQYAIGRDGAVGEVGINAFGVEQAALDIEQAVIALKAGADNLAAMEQSAFRLTANRLCHRYALPCCGAPQRPATVLRRCPDRHRTPAPGR
ncbi:hypothetical protein D3C77_444820 [compost metagenome]